MKLFLALPKEWQQVLEPLQGKFAEIDEFLDPNKDFIPRKEWIFRALPDRISDARILIIGQDPYPRSLHAMGLAFSVPTDVQPLPPSLRNIFQELSDDLNTPVRKNGDLGDWKEQGVVLLNRTLTTRSGESNGHLNIGWDEITHQIVSVLAKTGVIAILWGKPAQKFASLFDSERVLISSHPSPLSAYRGFFGSKPFSGANTLLEKNGGLPINWG